MDMFKKFAGGSKEAKPPAQGGQQKPDYLDQGFQAAAKKSGYGDKVGGQTGEKITDGLRGGFEKLTGKKVPEKFSN